MALVQTTNVGSSGGGGQTLAWQVDEFEITAPFASGFTLSLSQTPLDANSVMAISEGQPLESSGFTVTISPAEVEILFGADPATDTDDGIWHFRFQYPYNA